MKVAWRRALAPCVPAARPFSNFRLVDPHLFWHLNLAMRRGGVMWLNVFGAVAMVAISFAVTAYILREKLQK
jgi:hypothetical protein